MTTVEPSDDAEAAVRDCVESAEAAMTEIADYDQAAADELARAVAWAVYREDHAESLVDTTLEATGIGTAPAKRDKLRGRVKGILDDALDEPSVGELPTDRKGVVELAKPVGVVGGLVPSTNPASTAVNLAILALTGRNALVVSASPAGRPPTAEAVEYMREELAEINAPRDLVQTLPAPASKAKSNALLHQADLVQVTGSAANVAAAQESGTPNYCVSAGNPVALVDETVDLDRTARTIVDSTAHDAGITCIAESCAVAPETVYDDLRARLTAAGGYRCEQSETDRLRETLFPGGQSHPDRSAIGQPAATLAAEAGIDAPDATALIVEPDSISEDPLVTECLAPVLATVPVADFEAALATAERILDREGAGHSVAIHTANREHAVAAGRRLPVCRGVVNQPNLASAGSFANGLTHSYLMGGGTWAGNQLAANLSCREFIQTTRIAFPESDDEPSAADVFGEFCTDDRDGGGRGSVSRSL